VNLLHSMKRLSCLAIALGFFCCLGFGCSGSKSTAQGSNTQGNAGQVNPSPQSPSAATATEAIDSAVDPAHPPTGAKGLMVAYIGPDGLPTYKSYGLATEDGTVPLNENTLFGVGSLTNVFTGTLLGVATVHDPALLTKSIPVPNGLPNLRPSVTYQDLADHHGGLPKNCAHNLNTINDLWAEFTSSPIQCDSSNPNGEHDCGCCTPEYQTLLGGSVPAACDTNLDSVSCPVHSRTTGPSGFVYSNEGFEVLGTALATLLSYASWDEANRALVTQPLGLSDTMPREDFTPSQEARAANHCSKNGPNTNCVMLNWLPVGDPAGGLFSTAADMVKFLHYNMDDPPTPCDPSSDPRCDLFAALPIIHHLYEAMPGGSI